MNRAFFDAVRGARSLGHGGRLARDQVEGFGVVLETCRREGFTLDETAYVLATAWWETARTMQPIAERGGNAYFTRMYDRTGSRPALAIRMGNTEPGDGIRFRGRGYVQLTWRVNYEKAGRKLGVDLVANPDRAMEPEIAARIMADGMREGWFTGRKLSDYFRPGSPPNFIGARRIINGTDKDDEIAAIARTFRDALERAGYELGEVASEPKPVPTPPPPDVEPVPKARPGLWARILSAVINLFARKR